MTTRQGQKTPRRIAIEVQQNIEHSATSGYSAAEILRCLQDNENLKKFALPSLRTVQRMVKEISPRDDSGVWTLAGSETTEAAVVLDTLAWAVERTGGRITSFTVDQAKWIARVRRAAPDLHPWVAFLVAALYKKRCETGDEARDLDAYLGFAPWRSELHERRYLQAFVSRLVQCIYDVGDYRDPWQLHRSEPTRAYPGGTVTRVEASGDGTR